MRQKILLLAAVIFGLLAFYLNLTELRNQRNAFNKKTHETQVIELSSDIQEGGTISKMDITRKDVIRLANQRTNEIPWKSKDFVVVNKKADRTLSSGTVLRYSDIKEERTRRDGLAGVITLGNRAISISVDSTSSVTTLVKPEDRVDIVGSFRFPEMKGDKSLDVITMTILQSVRIIATGKEMGLNSINSVTKSRSKGYNTVTLELTPKEVEMIIFASQKGRLVLSLRSSEETGFEDKLQSVNFRYLEENIEKYNQDRKRRSGGIR